ncbi:MAG: TIGR01244 family sulfur transferase [Hyphomicrobiaceae bacterium]|nr:TIGR01244 family sulfur transferase [Hyphomicrobiaceae bacterium]
MNEIVYITPGFAVTGALSEEDFPAVAAAGFRAVINNRPDGEEDGQPDARSQATRAWGAGLQYRHIGASKHDLFTDAVVSNMADALSALEGPVLAHCKSGIRSAIVWAAAAARSQPVGTVLERLDAAGFDLGFLRDELDQQANRDVTAASIPPAISRPATSVAA